MDWNTYYSYMKLLAPKIKDMHPIQAQTQHLTKSTTYQTQRTAQNISKICQHRDDIFNHIVTKLDINNNNVEREKHHILIKHISKQFMSWRGNDNGNYKSFRPKQL